jgi:dinuclear metal center YbgI/SA1388 family protein
MDNSLKNITTYLEQEFNYSSFDDASLNGLQVEATEKVTKIGAAVDFGLSTAKAASEEAVDLLLTHHGLLWGNNESISGIFAEKVNFLLTNFINLVAIHLPLDAHEVFGNNAIIARDLLKLSDLSKAVPCGGAEIGYKGINQEKYTLPDLADIFSQVPGGLSNPLILPFGPSIPERICVVSGSAADALQLYRKEGFDTLITGESKQFAYHFCKEHAINAVFAGHYATETFGVKALAQHLAQKLSLDWVFIDEPTGI